MLEVRDEKDIKVVIYISYFCIDYEIYEVMMEMYKWEKFFFLLEWNYLVGFFIM